MTIQRSLTSSKDNYHREQFREKDNIEHCYGKKSLESFGLSLCSKMKSLTRRNEYVFKYELLFNKFNEEISEYKLTSSWKNPGKCESIGHLLSTNLYFIE